MSADFGSPEKILAEIIVIEAVGNFSECQGTSQARIYWENI